MLSKNTLVERVSGFTLSEVLITLGIIGIIAALTLPVLIQKHNNKVVETRLMKFYSAINQAVRMAEVEHGDKTDWYSDTSGALFDEEGKPMKVHPHPKNGSINTLLLI